MRWKRHDGVMNASAPRVQRVFFVLLLLHTLVAALIWGINTFFLLDAGLTNTRAFAANAFFTGGLVLFEDLERDELAIRSQCDGLGCSSPGPPLGSLIRKTAGQCSAAMNQKGTTRIGHAASTAAVSMNVYREKGLVAGGRNHHYLQLWRLVA